MLYHFYWLQSHVFIHRLHLIWFKCDEKSKDIQFKYKFVDGVCPDSSGIEVAKLAGLPQKVINICYDNSEYSEDNNKDLGATVKFFDIIKQCIFWKEKNMAKGKKNCEIEPFQLFNLKFSRIVGMKTIYWRKYFFLKLNYYL